VTGRGPLVSVVVPTYNYGRFLPGAVDSALRQDLADLEVIVVDDGSDDGTAEAVTRYRREPRVRYLACPHGGVSRARNAGIARARGRHVALLDADDRWPRRDKLSLQAAYLEDHPEVGWIFGDVTIRGFGEDERPRIRGDGYYREASSEPRTVPLTPAELWWDRPGIPTSSVLIRRDCFAEVGTFDESLEMYEDLDLWLRLLRHYPVAFIPAVLVERRVHGSNAGRRRHLYSSDLARLAARYGMPAHGVNA
jgi:glycosyltransferase involved in cell wall biosynthesis